MANSTTYQMLLKIGGSTDSSMKNACYTASKNLDTLSEAGSKIGSAVKTGLKVATTAIAAGVVAIGAATVAAVKEAYELGAEFDEAYDTIRVGTGATGDALIDLQDSMKDVYSTVPAEMADVATVIADYNTLLGATGDVLEGLSTQALQVADILDEDVSSVVEASSKAFQNWNIAEEDMGDAMDYVFKVSQSTGAGFTDLMGDLQTYGAQLQQVGYTYEDSAVLLGQMEKAGYDTSTMMTALKTAADKAADDGFENINDGIMDYIGQIQNAETETEAYSIATEVFGTKAAATMIEAIENGTLSLEDLQSQLDASTETIATAAEDTYSFSEKWEIFKNKMDVALEPVANTIFDTLDKAFDDLMPLAEEFMPMLATGIENLVPQIEKAAEWLGGLKPYIEDGLGYLSDTAIPAVKDGFEWMGDYINNTIIPAYQDTVGWIQDNADLLIFLATAIGTAVLVYQGYYVAMAAYTTVTKAVNAVQVIFNFLMTAGLSPVLLVAVAIGVLVAAGVLLYKNWDTISAKMDEVWGSIDTWVVGAIDKIGETFPRLAGYLEGIWTSISAVWENIRGIFQSEIDFITSVFAGDWEGAWDAIVTRFGNIFGMIGNLAATPINAVIGLINGVIDELNSFSIDIPDWVPTYGGQSFGFDINHLGYLSIPALADGGIATSATLAMIGEGSESEAILPLSKLQSLLNMASSPAVDTGSGGGGATVTFAPVYNFNSGTPSQADMEAANRNSFEEFKAMYQKLMAEAKRKNFA